MMPDDDPKELEKQEQQESGRRRRKVDSFLTLVKNAQNSRDKREQEEQRLIEEDRKAWDQTIEQIRRNQQQHEQDFDR